MTEETRVAVNKDVIDGSPVVKRETARIFTPLSKYPDGLSPTYGVDQCVLKDGRLVYQCVDPDGETTCEYWHLSGVSVRSHLIVHSRARRQAEADRIKAERDELIAREQQRRENYRNGARKTADMRRIKFEEQKAAKAARENGNEEASMQTSDFQKKLDRAQTSLEGARNGLDKVTTVLSNIITTLNNVEASLEDLATAVPENDPVLMEKAASYDALQALLNPNNKR